LPIPRDHLAANLRWQAALCARGDSPLYAALLEKSASDVEVAGPVWDVLEDYADEPGSQVVAIRFMAAVHRLVLLDRLPDLAAHYPSTGGEGDPHNAWPPFRQALIDHRDEINALTARRCQTNEVGRCASLLGGFLEIAHRSGLPLRILEIGASAGFNLNWDRYRYESADGAWGDAGSPVTFAHHFEIPPPMNRAAEVVGRKGCDLNPVDATSDEGALTLRSSIWADQLGRMTLLDGAIDVARHMPVEVEKLDAVSFLERELPRRDPEVATVVFHSIVLHYIAPEDRRRITKVIEEAGVFRLGLEYGRDAFEIRLNGEVLGTSGPHGTHVRWNVDSIAQT
jgi:hypothetical protein